MTRKKQTAPLSVVQTEKQRAVLVRFDGLPPNN